MKHVIYLSLLLTIAGCSSTSDHATTQQAKSTNVATVATTEKDKSDQVCTVEKVLGSNHKKKICRPKGNAHDAAIRNQEIMTELGSR